MWKMEQYERRNVSRCLVEKRRRLQAYRSWSTGSLSSWDYVLVENEKDESDGRDMHNRDAAVDEHRLNLWLCQGRVLMSQYYLS